MSNNSPHFFSSKSPNFTSDSKDHTPTGGEDFKACEAEKKREVEKGIDEAEWIEIIHHKGRGLLIGRRTCFFWRGYEHNKRKNQEPKNCIFMQFLGLF